jgi:hypothetical protein
MPADTLHGSEFDAFISHASEDKELVARPLHQMLTERGLRVWLDEQELLLGDALGTKIDQGLARSRFGIVILSPYFFAKHWPRRELDGLVASETLDGMKVILPVWHNVTQAHVTAESPTLGARLAVDTERGIDAVADEIEKVVRSVQMGDAPVVVRASPSPAGTEGGGVSGPASTHDSVLDLLRKRDAIGLEELQRSERSRFQTAVDSVTNDYLNRHLDDETVRDAGARLVAAAEHRAASLIPIALHQRGGLRQELRAHAGWISRAELHGGGMTWQQAWRFPWWVTSMTLGGLLCRLERFAAIGELLEVRWQDQFGSSQGFVGHPGEVRDAIAKRMGPDSPPGQQWIFPAWQWLKHEVGHWAWLRERYPDWLAAHGEPANAFAEFDMLDGLAESFRSGKPVLALWSLEMTSARQFARRLHADASIRAEVAEAVGVNLATFDDEAAAKLGEAHGVGMFPRTQEVAQILESGSD